MTLTKADIIDVLYNNGFSRKQSVQLLESLLEIIKSNLEKGDPLLISGFGKFSVREKGSRIGRNPKTGEEAIINERRIVSFKCSTVLRDKINGIQ